MGLFIYQIVDTRRMSTAEDIDHSLDLRPSVYTSIVIYSISF